MRVDIRTNSESEYGRWKNFAKLEKKKKTDAMCIFNDESDCRTYHKVLKVARTIADLDGEEQIGCSHLKEALGYRMLDKNTGGGNVGDL